jgi:hypothetical protein
VDAHAGLKDLQAAMDTVLASIARYAPAVSLAENGEFDVLSAEQMAALLVRMLRALDTDSPAAVRPVLDELDRALPPVRLAALHGAIENFDFEAGAMAIRVLAEELDITLQM